MSNHPQKSGKNEQESQKSKELQELEAKLREVMIEQTDRRNTRESSRDRSLSSQSSHASSKARNDERVESWMKSKPSSRSRSPSKATSTTAFGSAYSPQVFTGQDPNAIPRSKPGSTYSGTSFPSKEPSPDRAVPLREVPDRIRFQDREKAIRDGNVEIIAERSERRRRDRGNGRHF